MINIVQILVTFIKTYFQDLSTRFDIIVRPENVVPEGDHRMVVHLLLILFVTLYGVFFLELEATGTVNWSGLWNSPYLFTYQMAPAFIHRQVNQAMVINSTAQVLIFASYSVVRPIEKKFLLLLKENNFAIEKGHGLPLDAEESAQLLTFRFRYKRLLISAACILDLCSMGFFYLNVYLNGHYVLSVHCLLFYWGLLFTLLAFYIYFCEYFSTFYKIDFHKKFFSYVWLSHLSHTDQPLRRHPSADHFSQTAAHHKAVGQLT